MIGKKSALKNAICNRTKFSSQGYENKFNYLLPYVVMFFLQEPKFCEIKILIQQVADQARLIIYFISSCSSFSDEKEENFESYGENEDVEYEP